MRRFFDWITMDKGYARRLTEFGEITPLAGIETIGRTPKLTAAIQRAGWREGKIPKVMGENWLCVLAEVWGRGVRACGRSLCQTRGSY
jgi:membrane dipeptidase